MRGPSVISTLLAILVIQIISFTAPGLARSVQPPSGTTRASSWFLGEELGLFALFYSFAGPLQPSNEELAKLRQLRQVARGLGASIPLFPSRSGEVGELLLKAGAK